VAAPKDLSVRAPALPLPPAKYARTAFTQFNNVLRIYFNQLDAALRNAMIVQEPYELQVAKGQVVGASNVNKFGANSNVGTTEETIWTNGGNITWPAAAFTAYIVSSDAADTSAGTGARTVTVSGLDADYKDKTVSVTLNGTSAVAISGTWLRINRAFVTSSGTGGAAAGTITIQDVGATVVYANLGLGNQTQMAVYTVPAGHTLYVDQITFTAAVSTGSNSAVVKLDTRDFGSNTFRTRYIADLQSGELINSLQYPLALPEKTDIEARAVMSAGTASISAFFEGVLIAN
jgi:hypothetical protein